jgi:hypothetical protein
MPAKMEAYVNSVNFHQGDTIIQTFHAQGGTQLPRKKWNIECLDGEALVCTKYSVGQDVFVWIQLYRSAPYKPP